MIHGSLDPFPIFEGGVRLRQTKASVDQAWLCGLKKTRALQCRALGFLKSIFPWTRRLTYMYSTRWVLESAESDEGIVSLRSALWESIVRTSATASL